MINHDLGLLRKIAEMTCDCSLVIELDGQKFAFGADEDWVELTHIPTRENVEIYSVEELASFIQRHSSASLMLSGEELYFQAIEEVVKAALSPSIGIEKRNMEITIGSMAESRPDEVERLLNFLKKA